VADDYDLIAAEDQWIFATGNRMVLVGQQMAARP